MKKSFIVTLLLVVGFMFASDHALAAWTQAKGHSYNQLTLSHYKTVEKFTTLEFNAAGSIIGLDGDIEKRDSDKFTQTNLSYYGEYGITDNITGIVSGAWSHIRSTDVLTRDDSGPTGVGDITLGLRHKLMDNIAGTGVLSSVELAVKIPEAYDYESPVDHQNLGEGQYDTTFKLKFGKGFNWGYSVLDISYIYRFENDQLGNDITFKPSDQVKVALSGGYNVAPWLSIRGQLQWMDTVGNADVSDELQTEFYGASGLAWHRDVVIIKDSLALEQEVLSAGLALAFTVKPGLQVVLSYDTDLAGFSFIETQNAALGETVSLALAYSM